MHRTITPGITPVRILSITNQHGTPNLAPCPWGSTIKLELLEDRHQALLREIEAAPALNGPMLQSSYKC